MIRIGVFSDSHGALELFEKAVGELKEVSAIVHLGDCAADANEIARRTGKDIASVNGNCDLFSREPLFRSFKLEDKRIYATHGHREHVKMGLMRLFYRAEEAGADLVLYGHTHVQAAETIEGILFVNPGAMKDGRYAVIEIKDGKITPEFRRIAL